MRYAHQTGQASVEYYPPRTQLEDFSKGEMWLPLKLRAATRPGRYQLEKTSLRRRLRGRRLDGWRRRHDLDHVVRQRPLQRPCLIPRRGQPGLYLVLRGQDDRHRLFVDRLHDAVRIGREEAVQLEVLRVLDTSEMA
jgi:hypothetical protein